jgi:serine/threonine protein phosphatase PrpC
MEETTDEQARPELMPTPTARPAQPLFWRAFGATVRGKSHFVKKMPNQDAVHWSTRRDSACPLGDCVVAVADGHGDTRCVRSHRGSQKAVEAATAALLQFAADLRGPYREHRGRWKQAAETQLPSSIISRWRDAVEADLAAEELTEAERQLLGDKGGVDTTSLAKELKYKAYGTTLLAAMATEQCLLMVQIGDGALVAVNQRGEAYEPLPPDPRNFGNETTSLSSLSAVQQMRVRLMPLEGAHPVLLLLCTDGYRNAFSKRDFDEVAGEYLAELSKPAGWWTVSGYLEESLEEASSKATGDDASIAILFCEGACYEAWTESAEASKTASKTPTEEHGGSEAAIAVTAVESSTDIPLTGDRHASAVTEQPDNIALTMEDSEELAREGETVEADEPLSPSTDLEAGEASAATGASDDDAPK